jgi:hypothetical protein
MWLRSLFSVLLPVFGISASEKGDALESVAPLAAALSDSDPGTFIAALPRDAPNIDELRNNVRALIAQAIVTSSVEVIREGSGEAELDWYLEIKSRATGMIIEARRGTVRIRHEGRKLRAISPASHFAPPKP